VARVSGHRRRGSGPKVDVAGALGVPGGDGDQDETGAMMADSVV
jgi:hypothetical protein